MASSTVDGDAIGCPNPVSSAKELISPGSNCSEGQPSVLPRGAEPFDEAAVFIGLYPLLLPLAREEPLGDAAAAAALFCRFCSPLNFGDSCATPGLLLYILGVGVAADDDGRGVVLEPWFV